MATKKSQNSLREQIIGSGNVRPAHSVGPSEIRHIDRAASQAAAIAARRADVKIVPSTSKRGA